LAEARSNLEIEDGSQWRARDCKPRKLLDISIAAPYVSANRWAYGVTVALRHSYDINMLSDLRPLVRVFGLW